MNARSDDELRALTGKLLPFLHGRRDKLATLLAESESGAVQASEKTKAFWQMKKIAAEKFIQVFEDANKSAAELSDEGRQRRDEYLQSAKTAWGALADVLGQLHKDMIGPYVLGA